MATALPDSVGLTADGQNFRNARFVQDAYTLVNASLSWELPNEKTRVRFYGKNITNEDYSAGVAGSVDTTASIIRFRGEPRTFGVELSHSFGG